MVKVDLRAATEALEARREALQGERAAASLDALSGDEEAVERLREIEEQIKVAARDLELHALAEVERDRREREAAEHAERDARMQAEREADRLSAKRDDAVRAVQAQLANLEEAVRAFTLVDLALEAPSRTAGRGWRTLRPVVEDLCLLGLRDAGLGTSGDSELPYVWETRRRSVRAMFPPLEPTAPKKASPAPRFSSAPDSRCTVCAHENRSEIEAQLEAGTSYRDIESEFQLSRSALSRHRKHGTE